MKMFILKHGNQTWSFEVGLALSMILTLGGFTLGASVIYELPGISHETGTWLFVGWMVLQTIILRYIEIKITES